MDQLNFLWEQLPNLLIGFPGFRPGGLLLTMALAAVSLVLGFGLALLVGSGALSQKRPLALLARLFVEIFRGLPLVLLLLLVHQLLTATLPNRIEPRNSALIALTLYSAAYQAEVVKAGLRSVPPRLVESAQLLGSSRWQIFWLVKFRYLWRTMLPAFTGEAISLLKDSSVVVILGVADLMTVARIVLGSDFSHTPYWVSLYLLVGLLYMSVALSLFLLARRWERKQQIKNLVYSLANY